jgi:hypothetical protein
MLKVQNLEGEARLQFAAATHNDSMEALKAAILVHLKRALKKLLTETRS